MDCIMYLPKINAFSTITLAVDWFSKYAMFSYATKYSTAKETATSLFFRLCKEVLGYALEHS